MGKRSDIIGRELVSVMSGGAGDVLVDIFSRVGFGSDSSIYQIIPMCVVRPRDTSDVVGVVNYARDNHIAIAARGAGSGTAGESLCEGIVIDMVQHMDRIVGVEEDGAIVTCEPGVVLDDLNGYLAKYGRKIGPDPSSGNRAVMGGVVANNATGAHSLVYGYIAEHVEGMEVVLASGEVVWFSNGMDAGKSRVAGECYELLAGKGEVIANALPKTRRNRCGYNIAGVCHDGKVDMAKLFTGSEGTLGVITKLRLRTVEVPRCKGLVQFDFVGFDKMAEAVGVIVDCGASACELMDRTLIDLAVGAFEEYSDIFSVDCAAVLMVEMTGDSDEEVREKIEACDVAVGELSFNRIVVLDAAGQRRLWKSRKDAVPLLQSRKGAKQAVGFIEDTSVRCGDLGRYIAGLEAIAVKYDISVAYYGHAGDGELHVRPYLDLSERGDVEKMRAIANDVFGLVFSLGGTISGEHGDGLVRAAFIKEQYGAEYYELLKGVKRIFDPEGVMNPGKVLNDDPDVMVKNLRAGVGVIDSRTETNLFFEADEYRLEIGQCSGDGVCRSRAAGSRMCPVFRAVGEELACSRAKANLLRAWITGVLQESDFESEEFKGILELCINCKMCAVECPSGVDISKLMVEARAEYVKRKGLSAAEFALTHNRWMSMAGSLVAPLSNAMLRSEWFRAILEKGVGLDRRRVFPRFEGGTFVKKGREYLAGRARVAEPADRVAYFVDSYVNYNDHGIGDAVLKVLGYNDVEVVIPEQRAVPMPAMVYGDVKTARRDLEYIVGHLAGAVRKGYTVVCSEPSAALGLRDELRLFVDSEDAKLVSGNTVELMSYLAGLGDEGKLKEAGEVAGGDYVYHSPCHLCALGVAGKGIEVLNKVGGIRVRDVNAGCCGLAGTCGMQRKNFDLSAKIGAEMASAIKSAEGAVVLTECSACRMQIEQLTGKEVKHPVEILAKAYN